MKAYEATATTVRAGAAAKASDLLRVAVTFKRPDGEVGPTKFGARLSSRSVGSFVPDPVDMDKSLHELNKRGFMTTIRGQLTASMRVDRATFEKVFGTKLSSFKLDAAQNAPVHSFLFPADGAPWKPEAAMADLIDDCYIQWPHVYMGKKPRTKPKVVPGSQKPALGYWHLDVNKEVLDLLNVRAVHAAGFTGRGVKVAMIDSGFEHSHPYFTSRGYMSSVVLATGAAHRDKDGNGHGTGESANIFAIAPGVTFIGIKCDNEDDPASGASILEGFQEAMRHNPDIVSVSMGYDLRVGAAGQPNTLPHSLVALEAEIQSAVSRGVCVVFSAGNGHYAFPGQMREVISAGGVYVDQNGAMRASNYASAFPSKIYSGRNVPDFCGLVGLLPHADYIALPVPNGCEIDREGAAHDQTGPNDGWGVFSGTSAAAPQLAGICALLIEKNPGLLPTEIKSVLKRTSRDVSSGNANPASDENGQGIAAGAGTDSATGAGLVDAFAAFQQV